MAASSSIARAQEIKLCELCQEGNLKWRCIDCDQCICERCKNIHTRMPIAAKHQIETISMPVLDVPQKISVDNIPCRDHGERTSCMFCQTCECSVCPECVSVNHSKHEFVPLELSVDRKLDQLQSVHANIINNLKYCELKNISIQDIKVKYQRTFEESIEKIQQKERDLKQAISEHANELQSKVEDERSKVEGAFSKVEQLVDHIKKGLENQKGEVEIALKSTKGALILETKTSVPTPDITFDSLPEEVAIFSPKEEKMTQIQELFGSLQKIKVGFINEEVNFKVLRTLPTDLPFINKLLTQTENSAWIISNCDEKVLRSIDITDNLTSKEISVDIFDMEFTINKDILFSDFKNLDVKQLSQSGEIKPFLSVKPLIPRGIHVTRDNMILVGVLENCNNGFKVTKKSKRAIIEFDMNGLQKNLYEYDKNGKRLFTLPWMITTNLNQDIIVIDRSSGSTGRVVCLDMVGRLKYTYEGQSKINVMKEFDPRGFSVTSVGNLLVSDYNSHALHVLSGTGDLIFSQITQDLEFLYPWAIDIDRKGQIWVGCGTGGGQTGAKIHIVKGLW